MRLQAATLTFALLLLGSTASPANAAADTEYPSWADVQRAQAAEASTKTLIARIREQLATLKADAERTRRQADQQGAIWTAAQLKADEQGLIVDELTGQADKAAAKARDAKSRVAGLLAATARSGAIDLTATLLLVANDPGDVLSALSMSDRLSDRSSQTYASALIVQRNAQSLADQADAAKAKLVDLQETARVAFEAASAAAVEAEAKLAEQQQNEARLAAQLRVLTEQRRATEADYIAGIQARWGPGAAGVVSASGWARPARGYITSGFGWRVPPTAGASSYHGGLDFSGANYCGSPVYAARGGTVVYAGPNGGLGNYIQIDHGNGYVTGYAHLKNGGIGVRIGQSVGPGQHIGDAGTTGVSTGCHLHLILRKNGTAIDPLAFLKKQGVVFG